MSGTWALAAAVFLACTVEAVEATTIVLAAGTARDWRSALTGMAAALLVLTALTAALGPALTLLPIGALRLVVGGLLLVFGLQWLQKAVLRAGGVRSRRDEAQAYTREVAAARGAPQRRIGAVRDWYAFTLSFKGVLLEGLEVVFIVLTFGANQHNLPVAAVAAAVAIVAVAVAGAAVRAPLARVPENTLKFVVGVLLTSFGMFWGAEGAGAAWPASDAVLLALIPSVAALAIVLSAALRHSARRSNADARTRALVARP